jgi:hypothetical protein
MRVPPSVLAAAASLLSGACITGFTAAAWTARSRLAQGAAAEGPLWPLVLIAATVGVVVAVRLLVCALATTVTLLLADPSRPGTSGVRTALCRVALTASPRVLRPALGAVLLGGLAIVAAAPATAASVSTTHPVSATSSAQSPTASSTTVAPAAPADRLPAPGWHALGQDGWRPSPWPRPASSRPISGPELVTSGSRGCAAGSELVVRRGDTLWHLAARALGPGASDAEIAAEWPRWWAANREQVGADPDLILPGTRLCAPSASGTPDTLTTKEQR